MSLPVLHAPRLDLVPAGVEYLRALLAGPQAFEQAHGWRVVEGYLEFPEALEYSLVRLQRPTASPWWQPLLFVERDDQALVGLGGFKGPPDAAGTIELGYGVAPAYRRRGLATEATRRMLEHAASTAAIARVCAHTQAEAGPSTLVLERCGFSRVAEIDDPDDGQIWRWEIAARPGPRAT